MRSCKIFMTQTISVWFMHEFNTGIAIFDIHLIIDIDIGNISKISNLRIISEDIVFIYSILRKNPQIWEQWTVKCLWYQFMIPKGWIVFYILCLKVYYSFVSYQNPKGQERVRLIWVGNIWHISCLRKICLFS